MTIDPLAEDYGFQTPYAYAANNPIIYIDENGENPLLPILKGLAGAAVDYFLQGAVNYATGMSAEEAWLPKNIDMADVAVSGVQGAVPWTIPGGKYGKAALAAIGDVSLNFAKAELKGEDYTLAQAGQDFIIGFTAQLGAERMDEFIDSQLPQASVNRKLRCVNKSGHEILLN